MEFPKYMKEVIAEGRLRIFDNSPIADIRNYESYTFYLFPSESWVRGAEAKGDKKTIALAEKIVSFAKRKGGNAAIGDWDWIFFQPAPVNSQLKYGLEDPAEKVWFLKIGITDPVAFEIEKEGGVTSVLEHKGDGGDPTRFVCDRSNPIEMVSNEGWFLTKSELSYLYKEEDIEKFAHCNNQENLILYSRSYHDKHAWRTTWFDGEAVKSISDDEIRRVGDERMLIGEEATRITFDVCKMLPNGISDIRNLIYRREAEIVRSSNEECNLYFDGKYADYWIRLISRQGDYNMYVKAFTKTEKTAV